MRDKNHREWLLRIHHGKGQRKMCRQIHRSYLCLAKVFNQSFRQTFLALPLTDIITNRPTTSQICYGQPDCKETGRLLSSPSRGRCLHWSWLASSEAGEWCQEDNLSGLPPRLWAPRTRWQHGWWSIQVRWRYYSLCWAVGTLCWCFSGIKLDLAHRDEVPAFSWNNRS
jgi:hypothetical protein